MKLKSFQWILLLIGLFILSLVIRKIGFQNVFESLELLRWKLILSTLLFAPTYLFYTLAWNLLLKYSGQTVPFWRLFRIKLAGETISAMTPVNFAGGDPIRVWLLSKNLPTTLVGASVLVDRTFHIFAMWALILLGTLCGLIFLRLPPSLFWTLVAALFFFSLLAILFFVMQYQGLFERLGRWSASLRIHRFSKSTLEGLKIVDQRVRKFYREAPQVFWICLLLHFIARLFSVLEIFTVARFLGISINGWQSLFFAAVIPMTNFLSLFVPGTMGILEGVISGLFYLIHWNPAAGVALQMARRLRAGVWYSLGFLFLFFYKRTRE